MKKYSLSKTWRLCLEMWRWVKKMQRETGRYVIDLKSEWCGERGLANLENHCFFCDYAKDERGVSICKRCPAILIDPHFNCCDPEYSYHRVNDFYAKISELNRIRLSRLSRLARFIEWLRSL